MAYRRHGEYPETLGEFVRLDWTLRGSCARCALGDHREIDIRAAIGKLGEDYPTYEFMLGLNCDRCGQKLGLLDRSPEDRAADEEWRRKVLTGGTWAERLASSKRI